MTIDDIPKPWRQALKAVQTLFPQAQMGGGCLRDRETGVKVKDIDLFLPSATGQMEDALNAANVLTRAGWQEVKLIHDETYMGIGGGRMVAAVETKFPGCPPIQINVGQWDMDQLAESFDFGICQITFDGTRVRQTEAYRRDRAMKRFTYSVDSDDERFIRSINRWARLKEKYPTWTFDLGTRKTPGSFTAEINYSRSRTWNHGLNLQQVPKLGYENYCAPRRVATKLLQQVPSARVGSLNTLPNGDVHIVVDNPTDAMLVQVIIREELRQTRKN